jgi:hypothetical protein
VYRVHATNSFTADIIPLALASDATVTATWTKAALSAQPAYLLDTALGAMSVAQGQAGLNTVWATGPQVTNDMTGKVRSTHPANAQRTCVQSRVTPVAC